MGSGQQQKTRYGYRKEFWWEREWRHVGDYYLVHHFIGLCPEDEIKEFRALTDDQPGWIDIHWIDPRWGLEQIIAHLAGFLGGDIEIF